MKTRLQGMLGWILALICLGCASTVLAQAEAKVKAAAGPGIRFESETLELGAAIRGQQLEAEFVYHNTGDQPLKILKAKPG